MCFFLEFNNTLLFSLMFRVGILFVRHLPDFTLLPLCSFCLAVILLMSLRDELLELFEEVLEDLLVAAI